MPEQVKRLNVEINLEKRPYEEVVGELIQKGDQYRVEHSSEERPAETDPDEAR